MNDLKEKLIDLLISNKPTYIGLIIRASIVLVIQGVFCVSPFNFSARISKNTPLIDELFMLALLIGSYTLLMTFAIQAINRIGTVADEYHETPYHEKLITIIVLVVVILLCGYVFFNAPPSIPWYLEE